MSRASRDEPGRRGLEEAGQRAIEGVRAFKGRTGKQLGRTSTHRLLAKRARGRLTESTVIRRTGAW